MLKISKIEDIGFFKGKGLLKYSIINPVWFL
jgi:hypothetical protein